MKDFLEHFLLVEKKLKEGREIKPFIDKEKAMRQEKTQKNEELDIVKDFVYYDKMCGIVNEMLESLVLAKDFLEKNKEELIKLSQQKNKTIFDDDDSLSDEEKQEYLTMFDKIFSDEKLTDKFFNEIFPKNLEKEFGISKEEYEEILKTTDEETEKEILLHKILEKIILSQQENPEDLINLSSEASISDRLKNSGPKMNL